MNARRGAAPATVGRSGNPEVLLGAASARDSESLRARADVRASAATENVPPRNSSHPSRRLEKDAGRDER